MSTFRDAEIACARCAHRFPAEVADAVHVATRAALREAVLAGDFHRFLCPRCGHHTTIEKLMAYTDFDRHHWFTVVPSAELPFASQWCAFADETFRATMIENCPAWIRDEVAPEMRRRVVFGLASLREKLVAHDAGLDDRALELMKLTVLRRGGRAPRATEHLHLVAVDADRLQLALARPDGIARLAVPRSWYVEAEAALEGADPALFDGPVVDYRAELVPSESP